MKKFFAILLVLLSILLVVSCAKEPVSDTIPETSASEAQAEKTSEPQEKDSPAYDIYVYEGEGFPGAFAISLFENGQFSYYEGGFSSFIGAGDWEIEGDILTLRCIPNGNVGFVHRFKIEEDHIAFLAEESDNFMYVKVPSGGKFYKNMEKEGINVFIIERNEENDR